MVCVALTGNLRWADAPGNLFLPSTESGLEKDAVANVSQIITLDRSVLDERVGQLSEKVLAQLLLGIDVVLGR